jgi:hypothetical protein
VIDGCLNFLSCQFQIDLSQGLSIVSYTVGYLLNDVLHGDRIEDISGGTVYEAG